MRSKETRSAFAAALATALLFAGCSAKMPPPGGRLPATQQLLATEAIDRALAQLDWPDFGGRSVFVDIGSPAAEDERHYLQSAVEAAISEHGGRVTPDRKAADYAVVVLGKAIGVDENRTFFGIPSMDSAFLPVGLPEIALYKSTEQKGLAKLETVVTNRRGGHVSRTGPVESQTWVRDRRILVFRDHQTNAPEFAPLEPDD